MKRILALFIVLFVSTTAFAQTVLECTVTEVDPGIYAHEITITTDQPGSSFAANLIFFGDIIQLNAFGIVAIDYEADADAFIGMGDPPYSKDLDTWVAYPFAIYLPGSHGTGVIAGEHSYYISVGTDLNPYGSGVRLVQIVATSNVYYAGTVSRNSQNFYQSYFGIADELMPSTGDPYQIATGDTLTLDASASLCNIDYCDITSYHWDLDDDGFFETDAGDQAIFDVDYAYLESLGLDVGGPYDITLGLGLTVDGYDIIDPFSDNFMGSSITTLTIIPEPTSISLLTLTTLTLIRRRKIT